MTSRRAGARAAGRGAAARALLAAGLAVAALSGCACEGPKTRGPKFGPEVPIVRVKLGDDAPAAAVAVRGPWRLTGPAGDVASGDSLDWTDVTVQNGQVVFGAAAPVAEPLDLRGEHDGTIWLRQTVNGKARERGYRGALRFAPTGAGAVRVVNTLPMEAYLAGVLANELLKSWHAEAYRAQAVAARTYALLERNARTRYDFDVADSTSSQVYGGFATETAKSWEGARGTWGVVATCRDPAGKPVLLKTYYHSTCGGGTASAGSVFGGPTPPPLAGGVACTYCRKSPKFRWPEVVVLKDEIAEALRRSNSADLARVLPVQHVEVAERSGPGGRAQQIRIVGAAGQSVLVRAGYFRLLVGAGRVPSTWFEIEELTDRIVLKDGRGYGHGVGLCQWGAEYLAERGKTGEEILRYYYPKVELTRAY